MASACRGRPGPGLPRRPGGAGHGWDVWNLLDYMHYRDHIPRFCAEFGFQGPPTWATLTRWIHDEPLTPTSPAFLLHQKGHNGNANLERGLAAHLPVPTGFEQWHWATQLNQARAVAFGVVHVARHSFAGEALATAELRLGVPSRSTEPLALTDDLLEPVDPRSEVLVATAGGVCTHHLFGEGRDLRYDPAPFTADVSPVAGGYRVDVRATSYVRDLSLLADKLAADAVVDDMLSSLTAGETHHFIVHTSEKLPEPAALLPPRVLRCANTSTKEC